MIQKNIRDFNGVEFSVAEAAEWHKEFNDRTRSSQNGYNSIDELATKLKALEITADSLGIGDIEDLQSALNAKENAFTKKTAFNKNFGTAADTVLEGNWRPSWNDITSKPTTFTPIAHNHDDRYYTESESDERFTKHNASETIGGAWDFTNTELTLSAHLYRRVYDDNNVYDHYYPGLGNGSNYTKAHLRVWNGSGGAKVLNFDGLGNISWDGNRIWHSGNHGSGSGLDADKLDGQNSSSFFKSLASNTGDANDFTSDGYVNARPYGTNAPPNGHGTTLGFGQYASGFRQIHMSDNGEISVRALSWDNKWSGWKKLWTTGNDALIMKGIDNQLTGTVNWNSYTKQGIYKVQAPSASSNGSPPYIYNYGLLHVIKSGTSEENRTVQIYYPHSDSDPYEYRRMLNGSGWTSWRKHLAIVNNTLNLGNDNNITFGGSGRIRRFSHVSGFLEGSYDTYGDNAQKSNPIYTIGGNYIPNENDLKDMYGIGYTKGAALFLNSTDLGVTPNNGWGLYVAADGNARIFLEASSGNGYFGGHVYANQGVFRGNVTANSDRRLKKNIQKIDNALDKVLKLNGYTWDRKDIELSQAGVIAQEAQKVLPVAVSEGDNGMLSVDVSNALPALLIEAIKELNSRIDGITK